MPEPFSLASLGATFLNSKGGSALLGGLASGITSGMPAGPSNAESSVLASGLDGSGYSVNFSGVQSTSSAQDKSGGVPGIGLTGPSAGGVPWYFWAILAGVVLWRLKR